MSAPIPPADLTQRPPHSPRARFGGFVILPRMLDKGRAKLAKKNGEYNDNSPTDQHLVRFLGFDADALLKELAAGKGDGEILAWVLENSKTPADPGKSRSGRPTSTNAARTATPRLSPASPNYVGQHSKTREDIKSWFDALDLADYVSFGGKA